MPIRRFERRRARAMAIATRSRARMKRRFHPSAAVTTRTLCKRVAGSDFEFVMACQKAGLSRHTPPLRTQTANALSHSKFVECLPRCEDYNAIEYAREELAALQKTRSQAKFRRERTNSTRPAPQRRCDNAGRPVATDRHVRFARAPLQGPAAGAGARRHASGLAQQA